jgi:hypothetical protein
LPKWLRGVLYNSDNAPSLPAASAIFAGAPRDDAVHFRYIRPIGTPQNFFCP